MATHKVEDIKVTVAQELEPIHLQSNTIEVAPHLLSVTILNYQTSDHYRVSIWARQCAQWIRSKVKYR